MLFCSESEKEKVILSAIQESLEQSRLQQEAVPLLNTTSLKRGSPDAIKNSKSYFLYQDMVARAESKLHEAGLTNGKEEGESVLTAQQLATMWTICCEEVTVVPLSRCRGISSQFRTIDGTCNNLRNPTFGAHATIFQRLLPALYENGIDSPRGRRQSQQGNSFKPPIPSARHVSLNIHPDKARNDPRFTNLIWQWGQFIDHDITLSPESEVECEGCKFTGSCEPIRVARADPAFGKKSRNEANCLPFRRSIPACPINRRPLREQINDLTSFIDGSMIYGSTDSVARALRQFKGGLLKVGPNFPGKNPSLPRTTPETQRLVICMRRTDCFLAGDIRANEQTGLLIMHTIWVREHNRCARNIARINGMAMDEQIYQLCRKIVGAILQKITYEDWLPLLFGQRGLAKYVGTYRGYNPNINPGIRHAFATASFRFGHSMVQPMFNRLDRNFRPLPIGPLLLRNAFFNPPQYRKSLGTDPILRAMLTGQTRNLDTFIEATLTTRLFQSKTNPGLDLAALNIQRGRDHGLQPYLNYAKLCFNKFRAIPFSSRSNIRKLLRVYGSIKTVDLFPGGLNEIPFPGSIFGPTFACLNGIGFKFMRDGDRFFYRNRGVFTAAQLNSIRRHTLSRVLCDNMDDLARVQSNAFLVPRRRILCKSIPSFDFRPFRVDKLAEKEDKTEFPNSDLESEFEITESEMNEEAKWNGEDLIDDIENQDTVEYMEEDGVDVLKMNEAEESKASVKNAEEIEELISQEDDEMEVGEMKSNHGGCSGK